MTKRPLAIALSSVLVLVLAVGAYMWNKDRNTTTIDLPGDNQIEITK